ncbi:MAG: putative dehydrogenase [Paracoccaceae bacterium]
MLFMRYARKLAEMFGGMCDAGGFECLGNGCRYAGDGIPGDWGADKTGWHSYAHHRTDAEICQSARGRQAPDLHVIGEIADDPVIDFVIVATPPNAREQVVLNCTKGTAARNATTLSIYHRSGKVEEFGEVADTGGGADPMAFTDEWHQAIIRDFADSLGNGTAPFVTGREALHVHAMIYAIQMSAAEGRRVDVDKDIVNV